MHSFVDQVAAAPVETYISHKLEVINLGTYSIVAPFQDRRVTHDDIVSARAFGGEVATIDQRLP